MITVHITAPWAVDLSRFTCHRFIMRYRIDRLFDLLYPIAVAALETDQLPFRIAQFEKQCPQDNMPYFNVWLSSRPGKPVTFAFTGETEDDDLQPFINSVNLSRLVDVITKAAAKLPKRPSPVAMLWRYGE
jgi:hypothetical protein